MLTAAGPAGVSIAKLRDLLAVVQTDNPFYRRKLAGVAEVDTFAAFQACVPFTTKRELVEDQAAHPQYGSNLTYPLDRYTRFCQTSGTAGRPLRWVDTPESWEWMLGNWMRVFEAAGAEPGDRVFCAFSFGPFLGFWTAFEAATRMGYMAIPAGGMRSAARLALLLETEATILCCTPTYALHLAEVANEERTDLSRSRVRRIIVAGEPGGSIPGTRAQIEREWPGAKVVDHHGMTEIGPVSYGCPARANVLHVIEQSYIAEIIDPVTAGLAAPGAAGELVLTNLGRIGSPLIRYRTGDLVQPSGPGLCACGTSDLALEGGILGRTDDMVVVRGVNVYPGAVDDILRRCGGVAEYRVETHVSKAMVELAIQAEAAAGYDADDLAHRIEGALRDSLSLRIPVCVVPAGSLPRFEMKAKRWIRV